PPPPRSSPFPYTTLFRSPASWARSSGALPTCQSPVPAESMKIRCERPAASTCARMTASAVGERQIFPRQTKQIETLFIDFIGMRSEEHASELQSRFDLVC